MGSSDRLRIAQVAFGCNQHGGVERGVYEICRRNAADHEVHIFAEECELEADQVTFHRIASIRRPWILRNLGFFLLCARALRREQRRAPFDIVHFHVPCAIPCDVFTAHSVYAIANAVIKRELKAWQRAVRFLRMVEPVLVWLSQYNFHPGRCRRAIAVSQRVKRDLIKLYGIPPDRIDLVYRGVDSQRFSPAARDRVRTELRNRMGVPPEKAVAIFVANSFKVKGLDVLLKAIASLPADEQPFLMVVGATHDQDMSLAAARKLTSDLALAKVVHFCGRSEHIEKMYAAADFFAFPTLYEPFGQVITEAMASELPLICSRIAGAAEIVTNGQEGLLIEDPTDPREVAAKMRVLVRDSELRSRMGAAGRRTALRYTWDRVADLNMSSYQAILAERRREKAGMTRQRGAAREGGSPVPSRPSLATGHGRVGPTGKSDPLRIAQITFACNRRGGIERVIYELSKRFARAHEVHIFAGECELESDGVVFHKLPVIPMPWAVHHLGFFLTTRQAFLREHACAPFDIVHVQGIPSAIDSDLTTAHSVHCVGTDHQAALFPAWYRAWHYVKTADPFMRWLTGYNFRPTHCRRVIAISRQVKQDVVASFGMPPEDVEVIHNGVDAEVFSPVRRETVRPLVRSRIGLKPEATVAVFAANEFQRKGLDVLLKALARLDPSERPYLIVVGDTRDPALTLADCKRLCARMEISRWVLFVGASTAVENFLAAADLFVMPTIYEPFGLVILEAMASGLPVVFSRRAGATDIVEDGREALLIEDPTNPDEVAARMLPLIRSAALRQQMGAAGRKTALNYSWDIIAERTLASYEKVLSQRGSAMAQARGNL